MTLPDAIHDLEALKNDHAQTGKEIMQKVIYPLDFLAFAVLNRSLRLTSGFLTLIREKNLIAAAPLVRLQLDNCLRFFASTLVDQPHDFAIQVLGGRRIDQTKDRSGKRLTDSYLKQLLSAHEPWIDPVYKETSGFIHLSEKHIFNSLAVTDVEERNILMKISDTDEFAPEEAYIEAVEVFTRTTKLALTFASAWATQRNGPQQDKPSSMCRRRATASHQRTGRPDDPDDPDTEPHEKRDGLPPALPSDAVFRKARLDTVKRLSAYEMITSEPSLGKEWP
jgi:hypothetical protein